MSIIIDTPERIAQLASQEYVALLNRKSNAVLGFATGSTPLALYAELVRLNQKGELSFCEATSFNLDEYIGIDELHEQSYRHFMNQSLFSLVDIRMEKTFLPSGDMDDEAQLADFDNEIEKAGGIDIQLLGIGRNGHIGFNEPGTPFGSVTHVAELADSTVQVNSRFFSSADDVPRFAATMGIKTVMRAHKIILIALGTEKASIVKTALQGPVSEDVPASVLQLHPFITWYLDHEAAALL